MGRIILVTMLLFSFVVAQVPGFDACRVGKQTTIPLGVNWRVFRVDQWWGESSGLERAQAVCVAGAWAGTATVFALSPWSNNPKVMKVIQVAACVGVGGLFGSYFFAGLRKANGE